MLVQDIYAVVAQLGLCHPGVVTVKIESESTRMFYFGSHLYVRVESQRVFQKPNLVRSITVSVNGSGSQFFSDAHGLNEVIGHLESVASAPHFFGRECKMS